MNLEDIQETAKTLLEANPDLAGIPILADDGTYPQTPLREKCLSDCGIVVVVWEIVSGENSDTARSGRLSTSVELPISIEENKAINSTTGLGIKSSKVVRHVIESLRGKPSDDPFISANPPFANFGVVDGVGQWIANFYVKSVI